MFYHGFFFFFFFRRLIFELAERNSTKIGHMVGSKCSLKTHVQNMGVSIPHTNRGPKTTSFGQLRNLTANLTAYIFWRKHYIDNQLSALTTTSVSYIAPKCHELWSTNGFNWTVIYPPSENYAFLFIAGIRTRTSDHRTEPNFATR